MSRAAGRRQRGGTQSAVRCELIMVSDDLLFGRISDDATAWVSRHLAATGWECVRHTVLGEDERSIVSAVRDALERVDVVVVTGRLESPPSERIRRAVTSLAGAEHAQILEQCGRAPDGSTHGDPLAAPALIFEVAGRIVCALLGPAHERRPWVETRVLPYLADRVGHGGAIVWRTLHTVGVSEAALAARLAPVWDSLESSESPVSLAYLPGGGEVRIRLTAFDRCSEAAAAAIASVETEVRALLGDALFTAAVEEEAPEETAVRLLQKQSRTLAIGEIGTLAGGLVSQRIARVAASARCHLGSLHLPSTLLPTHASPMLSRAVDDLSEAATGATAQHVRSLFEADIGLAVAGSAADGQPASVCLAIADRAGIRAETRRLPPGDLVQRQMSAALLALLLLIGNLAGSRDGMDETVPQ